MTSRLLIISCFGLLLSAAAVNAQLVTTGSVTTGGQTVAQDIPHQAPAPKPPPPLYQITALPSDQVLGEPWANGIDDAGGVGITYVKADGYQAVLYWKGTQVVALPTLGGLGGTYVTAVNASGVLTGYSAFPDPEGGHWGVSHAYRWDPGLGMTDINEGYAGFESFGVGITDAGMVLCRTYWFNGWYTWTPTGAQGAFVDLPLPSGARYLDPRVMSPSGNYIVARNGDGQYLYAAPNFTPIPGGNVQAINDRGQAVGDNWGAIAEVWDAGGHMWALPVPDEAWAATAYGINGAGVIAGEVDFLNGSQAVIWPTAADEPVYLEDLLPADVAADWKLESASAINRWGQIAGVGTYKGTPTVFVLTPVPQLAVDANRDGTIKFASESSSDVTTAEKPYRFWLNDDNDSGSIDTADIPGSSTPDGQQVKVQGIRDLIDFFPVCLDLKQLVTVLPPSTSIKYKLKQADDALRFVYTDLSRADAFKYLRDYDTANALQAADAHPITSDGRELDSTWLGQVGSGDKGVILVEGRNATTQPLVLSVEKDGAVIAEVKLYLSIGPVEQMFRHLNLHDRGLPGLVGSMTGGTAQPQAMGDPTGFPDNQNSNDRWLIFIHGFNVSGQASRGWNAEMFKRFYWSGNRARFVGVSWFGNPDDAIGPLPSDYYLSVRNAMVTAPALAQEINALSGTKTIIGHSLGCGVIASAIADYGMSVSKACFVDAALARECFDGEVTSSADGMTPSAWKTYSSRLYAANWYKLFTSDDARSQLTWRNRFPGMAAIVHNFYSSTENVLGEYTGEVPENVFEVAWTSGTNGAFTWVFQEKAKGVREDFLLGVTHVGSYYGGWGFNTTDPLSATDPVYYNLFPNTSGVPNRQPKTNDQIGAPSDDVLRRAPVFDPGWGNPKAGANRVVDTSIVRGPSWMTQLFDATGGSAIAATPANRSQLLAEAVPALTWPVGSHVVQAFQERNYPLTLYADHWPRALINGVPEWRHSDMREVAYRYQYRFFDKLVTISTQ